MRQLKTENYSVILCRIQFGPCICIFRYAKSFSNWARALYRVVVSLSLQSMRCCLENKQTFNPTAADMYSRIPYTTGAQRPHWVSQSIWFMRFVSIVEVNVCTVFFLSRALHWNPIYFMSCVIGKVWHCVRYACHGVSRVYIWSDSTVYFMAYSQFCPHRLMAFKWTICGVQFRWLAVHSVIDIRNLWTYIFFVVVSCLHFLVRLKGHRHIDTDNSAWSNR